MKRWLSALLVVAMLFVAMPQSEAQAYYRRPLVRRGVAAAARVGVIYGLGRGYGYGYYPYGYGYPYGGFGYPYGYGFRPGFGIGFY